MEEKMTWGQSDDDGFPYTWKHFKSAKDLARRLYGEAIKPA